ncbi:MAG TPA: sigma-54 dependent transcriptional regulator [Bryobacteraceae bacterium]|nr:sigma-54 dependent transcriptional regulator [Bryobacteraceae bacterium]
MMAKVHTLEAPRFNLHRPVPRHDHELRYPYDHLKAAQAQDVANIVGGAIVRSEAMKSVFRLVERIARTSATVLISGETGSGKEVVARAVHNFSPRCERPWVDINCGALPDHLVESELFGYEKGAFSGADSQKPGLFELASGGTLFFDEVGELDARMQVKLLRVLDGVPYYRLGGTRKVSVDARIVAATNQNLEQAVAAGAFREDLFHRLNQVSIQVPPLRERIADVAPLAYHFLHEVDPRLDLGEDALNALEGCAWPGNVRELRNVITRAAVLAEGWEICAADLNLKPSGRRPPAKPGLKGQLGGVEEQAIRQALRESGGRRDVAAGLLGISRRTLLRRLKDYKTRTGTDSPLLAI